MLLSRAIVSITFLYCLLVVISAQKKCYSQETGTGNSETFRYEFDSKSNTDESGNTVGDALTKNHARLNVYIYPKRPYYGDPLFIWLSYRNDFQERSPAITIPRHAELYLKTYQENNSGLLQDKTFEMSASLTNLAAGDHFNNRDRIRTPEKIRWFCLQYIGSSACIPPNSQLIFYQTMICPSLYWSEREGWILDTDEKIVNEPYRQTIDICIQDKRLLPKESFPAISIDFPVRKRPEQEIPLLEMWRQSLIQPESIYNNGTGEILQRLRYLESNKVSGSLDKQLRYIYGRVQYVQNRDCTAKQKALVQILSLLKTASSAEKEYLYKANDFDTNSNRNYLTVSEEGIIYNIIPASSSAGKMNPFPEIISPFNEPPVPGMFFDL